MKKFLSVVMALAMTLTLVTVGASAKDFTDKSSISYKEAVDVISNLGVVDGYTDGSFNPSATLTRGAAAKIICNMILGPTTASALGVNAAPFTDVPVNNVFAGYIAYCSSQGIINGYGDGTFKPTATVTGYQFMKMLLGALGYDGSVEGFTGSNWTVSVAKLAVSIGLDDGNDNFVGSKAMTREEAALYAFNTLTATMVEYKNAGTTVTVNGATIVTGASAATKVAATAASSTTYQGYEAVVADNDAYMQFCEQYFPKLIKTTASVADEFSRTAHKWTYKTNTIGTYSDSADVVLTASTKADAVKTALSGYTIPSDLTTVAVYKNGGVQSALTIAANTTIYDTLAALTGNGKVVEFYANSSNVITRIVMIQYTYGEITKVKTTAATAYEGAYTTYSVSSSISGKVYSTTVDKDETDTAVLHGTFAKGDKVLYVVGDNGTDAAILHLYSLTTVSGALTSATSDGKYTISGTVYKAAALTTPGTFSVSTKSADFYLDSYGYLVATKTSSDKDYAFVLKTDTSYSQNSDGTLTPAYVATLAFPDGTVKTVYSVNDDGDAVNCTTDDSAVTTLGLTKDTSNSYYGVVTYSVNSYGYVLAKSTAAVAVTTLDPDTNLLAGSTYANADTQFIYAGYKSTDATKLSGSVSMVTGIANVDKVSTGANAFAIDTDTTPDGVADVVFVYANVSTTASSNYVYLTGTYTQTGSTSYAYDAFKNGEATTIVLSDTDDTHMTEGLYSNITVSGKAWSADEDAVALTDVTGVKVVGGLLYTTTDGDTYSVTAVDLLTSNAHHQAMIGTDYASVGSTVPMYEIDTGDNTCELVTDPSTAVEGTVYVQLNSSDDGIAAIYVMHA